MSAGVGVLIIGACYVIVVVIALAFFRAATRNDPARDEEGA